MVKLVNRAKVATATTGTGTITLGAAVGGFQNFAAAGVSNGDVVRYVIEDGDDWEIGTGTFTSSGTTLSRTVVESSNSGSPLNLTGNAVVFVSAVAADIVQPGDNVSTLTNDAGYTTNTGTVTSVGVTAGTGITVSGSPITSSGSITVTNAAPDQVVSLTGGSNVTVTGTYPSFTVAASNTNLGYTSAASAGTVTSSTGNNATLPAATTSIAGLLTSADKTKLDGIAAGAQVNVATNLGYTTAASSGTVTSSTGTNATLPAATTSIAGLLTSADKTKLDGIAAGAQVNVATNLGNTVNSTSVTVTSSTGTNTTLPGATTTNAGVFVAADKTKLDGIQAGAQVNVPTDLSVTGGTTAGPTINSSTGTNATIPTASGTASGVVTTNAQTFAGVKTFSSTISGSVNGNAATATALQTARTIGGVSFDGTANINLPGVNQAGNQNTTGSAASLTTARTIGGVSFDGTANINLPGVNQTGNQNTTGSAASLTTARTFTIGATGRTFDGTANVSWTTVEIGAVGQTATTGAAVIPAGTAAQRPTPAAGQFRFNSDLVRFEGYNGTLWGEFLSNVTASNFPAGTVIQVVQNATTVGTVSTTSTTSVDLTNATATITPRSTSSRILVLWTSQASNSLVTGANVQYFHTILRGATGLAETWIAAESGAGGLQAKGSQAMSVLDNPSTTSAVTYKIQHRTINASSTGTAAGGFLTLLEIAG